MPSPTDVSEDAAARPHWTFDKRVNVAHILTTLILAGSLAMYLVRQEARLVVLEEHRQAQVSRDERQDRDVRDMKSDIAALFKEIRDEIRGLRADLGSKAR